ncbi:MAG: sulfite exporter TauE/SafE family protein [Alphaproteobacteria bacterium]|nr:sulfite exporter TauE/SafE family protein [Alphaproteobacteria bacterium]
MVAVLSLTMLGFFLGMRHATDPDHVIAVSTIVTRQPTIRAALLIGSLWGVGHTLTIVVVGGAIVLFTIVIPPRVGLSMEMAVALMLIVLGMWNLTGILEHIGGFRLPSVGGTGPLRAHWHDHDDYVHSHVLSRGSERHEHHDDRTSVAWLDRQVGGLGIYQVIRPLIVGLVHGLAGSAAVALLVLALIKNPWWAMAYLVLFGIGTIAGMMLITTAIGAVVAYASRRSLQVERWLRLASGLLSLGFGLFLAYQIAVVDGLITGDPSAATLQ